MIKMKKIEIFALTGALVLGLIIGVAVSNGSQPLGGLIHNIQESFDAGIAVQGTEVIDSSGNYVGAVSGTTGAYSSTLSVTGVTTLSDELKVSNTASSTIQIGSTADGVGTGCLILGDSGSATATPVYIIASGSTITASTTQPAICQ